MEQNKALGLLSIARKARKIELGEEPVKALALKGHARLVLLASDAGAAAQQKAARLVAGTKQRLLHLPFDKATLGGALGYSPVSLCTITDHALAVAFVKALEPTEETETLLEYLEAREARFQKRARKK